MQSELYPLSAKDVENVAKGRVNREKPKQLQYLGYGSLIVMLAGFYVAYSTNLIFGVVGLAIGGIMFWVYTMSLDKKQKMMIRRLKIQWHEEMEKSEVK